MAAQVRAALDEPARRVRSVTLDDGRRFWLKRVERPGVLRRIQKGDPRRAFEAERMGLHLLSANGLPVAPVVMEGPDYLVTPDVGSPLPLLAADASLSPDQRLAGFHGAGRALGRLHLAGMVHGRPALRDICWDGRKACFIDLERFSPSRRGGFWQAADVVVLAQSCFTLWPDDRRWLDAVLAGYRIDAPQDALEAVSRLARRLRPLGWLAGHLGRLRPQSRELRAVPLTIGHLTAGISLLPS